jgi:endonuclease-3
MATVTNKQQLLTQVFAALKKRYPGAGEPEPRPVLEQLLYAVCREGATREQADVAFRNLKERFFDWNEVRVSSAGEIEEAFDGLPNPGPRALKIIGILQYVFETNYSFDLEGLEKKGLKQAAKQLSRYQDVNDYAVAWVMQQALGGHAIPLDEPSLRVLRRLGVLDDERGPLESLRGTVEHLVPKARGPQFNEMISLLAQDVCWEDVPNCSACPLRDECPTGQELLRRNGAADPRGARLKPR